MTIGMTMETTNVILNKQLVDTAREYAKQKGINLTELIEDYLSRLIQKEKAPAEEIPDIVLSFLGAGEHVDDDDLNGRKAYYEHLKEKYK